MESINKIFQIRDIRFYGKEDMEFIRRTLEQVESEDMQDNYIMKEAPVKPKGGSVIIFRQSCRSDNQYMTDQYFGFASRGDSKLPNHNVIKKYYQLVSQDKESETVKFLSFRKQIFKLLHPITPEKCAVIIHYIGDEKLFVPRPHGNSRSDRPFVRTSAAAIKRISEKVINSLSKPKVVYTELVKDILKTADFNESENCPILAREAINAPRNEKQVRNFKEKAARARKLNQCEIFSIYEMAKSDLSGCILKLNLIPNDVIVIAEPSIIKLANTLIKQAHSDKSLPQLLCYDTTFNLADSYVSVLVGKNTLLHGNPIFAIAFMIHDRKLEAVHVEFWRTMDALLNLQQVADGIPICTDREMALTNAIKKVLPKASLLYCNNHIKRDVIEWLHKSSADNTDFQILSGQLSILLASESEQEFEDFYDTFKFKWTSQYIQYIENHVKVDLMLSAKYNASKFSVFKDSSPTNNVSESMNFVIKHANDWIEFPLDSLVLHFIQLQCDQMLEFSRAHRGLGKYNIKKEFAKIKEIELPLYITFSETEFLKLVKENCHAQNFNDEVNYKPSVQSKEIMAQKCVSMGLVTLVSNLRVFLVRSPYTGKTYNVEPLQNASKSENPYKCNCTSSGMCYHKLAVIMSIGQPHESHNGNLQLSQLKKKTRGHKKRCGRKVPNINDISDTVGEAPDSQCAKLKRKIDNHDHTSDSSLEDFQTSNEQELKKKPKTVKPSIQNLSNKNIFNSNFDPIKAGINTIGPLERLINQQIPSVIENEVILRKGIGSCLENGIWLTDSVMDLVIQQILFKAQLTNVGFVSSVWFSTVAKESYGHILEYSSTNALLNNDVVLICVNSNLHWMLGVISFGNKTIYLIDSFYYQHYLNQDVREDVFVTLYKIASAMSFSGNLGINKGEWNFVYAQDSPEQHDSTECGVIVCLTVFSLVNKLPFPPTALFTASNMTRNRRWLLSVLASSQIPEVAVLAKKRMSPSHKKRALHLMSEIENNPLLEIINGRCCEEIYSKMFPANSRWTICDANSCYVDIDHLEDQFQCVSCRKWEHRSCSKIENVKACDYHFCAICQHMKLSF